MTEEELEDGRDEEELDDEEGVWVAFIEDDEDDSVTRWFPTPEEARQAMIAVGMSPGQIKEALDPTPPQVWLLMVDVKDDDTITYEAPSMGEAIQMALRFSEELGADSLDVLRTLEQAAADGEREVTVGPFTIMGPEV